MFQKRVDCFGSLFLFKLTTYNRAAGYLNTIFKLLNERYFEGALSKPVITIQSTPKAYGHYTLYDAWSVDGEKGMREINIGAGTLSRPIEEVVATLLHEMVHFDNDMKNIKDCSRGNTYHNKHFRNTAERCGLTVEHHPTYGWSRTIPSDDLINFCIIVSERKYRTSNGYIIPYVEHTFPAYTVQSIKIAPLQEKEIAEKNVIEYLSHYGYGKCDVSSSDIPIRF